MKKTLIKKIEHVRLVIFDVDGVMTDGRIHYTDQGVEIKSFNVKDGHGIKLLMRAGIEAGIITARQSKTVDVRARDLGITIVAQGRKDKLEAFEEIIKKQGIKPEEAAYVGDDVVDLPVLRRVGFSVAVSDAVDTVKAAVDYVTRKKGGNGAVREVVELILKAQGKWDSVMERYLR
ncbi:MAG: HAD family hydrolase [Deltaproteobacteria bacterium]|nr:HAD family hydrolase [Deltaproteobacteria bacterium]